jgi:hypothetical protein
MREGQAKHQGMAFRESSSLLLCAGWTGAFPSFAKTSWQSRWGPARELRHEVRPPYTASQRDERFSKSSGGRVQNLHVLKDNGFPGGVPGLMASAPAMPKKQLIALIGDAFADRPGPA